jgi:hypothetical protein
MALPPYQINMKIYPAVQKLLVGDTQTDTHRERERERERLVKFRVFWDAAPCSHAQTYIGREVIALKVTSTPFNPVDSIVTKY